MSPMTNSIKVALIGRVTRGQFAHALIRRSSLVARMKHCDDSSAEGRVPSIWATLLDLFYAWRRGFATTASCAFGSLEASSKSEMAEEAGSGRRVANAV